MTNSYIQQIFLYGYSEFTSRFSPSSIQRQAAHAILNCKTGALGYNISQCTDCGHVEIHNNSCRNRHCPSCQSVPKERWIDQRRSEVVDAPYFHVVFTLPAQLNALIYANQKLLYDLLHRCSGETLLELSSNPKYLGAKPGIIQILHTWGQSLNFHPHIHCVISGAGLTKDFHLKLGRKNFFLPQKAMARKFRGKFLAYLQQYFLDQKLMFPPSCCALQDPDTWNQFRNALYEKEWQPFIKETFRNRGNAIDYLGRYTHRIAISNARIKRVTPESVTFSAKDYKDGGKTKLITISNSEFIRRFLMHILPKGFQKIRYFGFLCNRCKRKNLARIFLIQGRQRFQSRLTGLSTDQILKQLWNFDIHLCSSCGKHSMRQLGKTFAPRN